jgi:hypothetical protein
MRLISKSSARAAIPIWESRQDFVIYEIASQCRFKVLIVQRMRHDLRVQKL